MKDVDKIIIRLLEQRKQVKNSIELLIREYAKLNGKLEGLDLAIEEFERIAKEGCK